MGLPVIPNEEKHNEQWKQIVNEPGPVVFSNEGNHAQQLKQITQQEAANDSLNEYQLMIPENIEE